LLTLDSGKEVNTDHYPTLNLTLSRENNFNGNVTLTLLDTANCMAGREFTVGNEKCFQTQLPVGSANADLWQVDSGFDWQHVNKVRLTCGLMVLEPEASGLTACFLADAATAACRRIALVRLVLG
jgi:hypothetical protein